jgi:hypothetical protein
VSPIEKHRSEPKLTSRDGYEFPDVFDPAWEAAIQAAFAREVAPLRDDPMLIGWLWTDTPTWDLLRTRALRGTFLDGKQVFTFADDGGGPEAWPYDKPHYLILNVAIGGAWGGMKGIDDAIFPQKMLVDYVRYWKRDG